MKRIYNGVEYEIGNPILSFGYVYHKGVLLNILYKIRNEYVIDGKSFGSIDAVDVYLTSYHAITTYKHYDLIRVLKHVDDDSVTFYTKVPDRLRSVLNHAIITSTSLSDLKQQIDELENDNPESNLEIGNDNRIAISILESVTSIMSAIESDDSDLIELGLSDLKNRVDKFEKVYYNNKCKGVYDR